jgi:hypothetical protein
MRNLKRIVIAMAVIFLVGATPALAELDGTWAGEGEGWCCAPDGSIIYAWQTWIGEVAKGAFKGHWEDSDGNGGTFEGGIIYLNEYTAYCKGKWTWISPDGATPIVMGPFDMLLHYLDEDETCGGTWTTPDAAVLGTMWGERIGD